MGKDTKGIIISKTYSRNCIWWKVVMVQDPSRGGKMRLQM